MMLDVQGAEPLLLAQRDGDEVTKLDQLRLTEVLAQPLPEGVVGLEAPDDGVGIGERRLLARAVARRLLELEKGEIVLLLQPRLGRFDRALMAAVLALP